MNKDEILFNEWQTCVNLADSISKRRDHMNNIFVTINIAFITSIIAIDNFNKILILIVGLLLPIIWILLINNYRKLNIAKFKVINELEQLLPFKPMIREFENLKKIKRYIDFSLIEIFIPLIFIFIYISIFFIL